MARGVNRVILVGNLGKDPIIRQSASGAAVTAMSLATSEEWKDAKSNEKKEKTEWHRLVAFNKLAEICGQYLKSGSKIYVEGKIQTRKYLDKHDGTDRFVTEIHCDTIHMLDGKNAGDNSAIIPKVSKPAAPQQNLIDDDIPF